MRARIGTVLVSIGLGATTALAGGGPTIGGAPIHTQDDAFAAATWGVQVWSFVFDSGSALPAGFTLDPGQMLFVYLLDGDDTTTGSVEMFSVANPFQAQISGVGYVTNILPPGFDMADRQDPFLYGYNGLTETTVFTYADNPLEPFPALDPEEWSLVWFEAEAESWALGTATVLGAGSEDSHMLPVPTVIPSPGIPVFLGVALLLGARRRRF